MLKLHPVRTSASETLRRRTVLAISSLLLILLSLSALQLRRGNARWEAIPGLLIGSGLLLSSIWRRRQRRREMLRSLLRQRAERRPVEQEAIDFAPGRAGQ